MLMGKRVRLNRLLNPKSGRMLSVAIDHTIAYGMIPGLEPVQDVVDKIVAAQPESMTLQKGIFERCFEQHAGRVGIILQSMAANPFEPDVERPVADVWRHQGNHVAVARNQVTCPIKGGKHVSGKRHSIQPLAYLPAHRTRYDPCLPHGL